MTCPLLTAGRYAGRITDDEVGDGKTVEGLSKCSGQECGWWVQFKDEEGKCGIAFLAIELACLRTAVEKKGSHDWKGPRP